MTHEYHVKLTHRQMRVILAALAEMQFLVDEHNEDNGDNLTVQEVGDLMRGLREASPSNVR